MLVACPLLVLDQADRWSGMVVDDEPGRIRVPQAPLDSAGFQPFRHGKWRHMQSSVFIMRCLHLAVAHYAS
ncbi:hypothetical protein B5K11_26750 [Rhizobium leguminosarum bv. trifolii]|nr:hypothetical protein B5K11_26750 [Rhizobium leguminosarum bv. trifolii]